MDLTVPPRPDTPVIAVVEVKVCVQVEIGFAFVEMATAQEAQEAIKKCRGVELDGNKLIVKTPKPKKGSIAKRTNTKQK